MAYGYQPGNYSFMTGQMGQSQSFGDYSMPQAQQPTSNKLFVVSAEDALSRFAAPNSIMIYLLQDESTLYEVYTDGQGKKSIRARTLTDAAHDFHGTRLSVPPMISASKIPDTPSMTCGWRQICRILTTAAPCLRFVPEIEARRPRSTLKSEPLSWTTPMPRCAARKN